MATLTFEDSFLRDVFRENENNASTTLSLLFMEGFATATISSGNCYYLFDSHSHEERGLSLIDGTSVLMKFNDLFDIEKCIQVAYLEYRDRQQAYFQIQFMEVTVGSIEKTEIYLQFAKNARREHDREHSDSINKRQRVYYSNLKGSPQHRRINEKKKSTW